MKTSNTDIFRCLCSDLDMPLLDTSKVPTYAVLGELRKQFLLELENPYYNDSKSLFIQSFGLWFNISTWHTERLRAQGWFNSLTFVKAGYQLLSFGLKIPKPYTHEQETAYLAKFSENEALTRAWRVNRNNPISRIARQLTRRLVANDLDLSAKSIWGLGRHGPGAVYGHEAGSDKNFFSDPPHDLALTYGHEFFFCNSSFLSDYASSSTVDRSNRHVISRLALVPKDYKGPRGVFVSPKEVVFCQLAQDEALKDLVKKTWLGICWNPTSQSPSQEAAFIGSATGAWDTLDLSDASDRLPLSLVSYLFPRADYLALARTRPSYVELPNGEKRRLAMFSPMGDGKTFSVLSVVVCVIVLSAILDQEGYCAARPIPRDVVVKFARKLRVFGDDIAVEHGYFANVCKALETHNLKVNQLKSFHLGSFRESCGLDAFNGVNITPVRQKVDLNENFDYFKAVEFHNRMFRFYPHLSRTMALLRSLIETSFPLVGYTSNCTLQPTCLMVDRTEVTRCVLDREARLARRMSPILPIRRYSAIMRRRLEGRRSLLMTRFNDQMQVIEQRTYAPVVEQNSITSLDPWWDLNYWLLTSNNPYAAKRLADPLKGESSDASWLYANHIDVVGSRTASKQYEEIYKRATGRSCSVRSVSLRQTWSPVIER